MATRDQLIEIARKYRGVTELPPGSNLQPFAAMAGHPNGYAWCASYAVAVFREAAMPLPSESAWTPTMAQGFRNAGTWHDGAAGIDGGDVLFWDFPDKTTGIEHVSIATGPVVDGEAQDISGNTTSGPGGSEDNGGGVFERHDSGRNAAWIVGYGRPAYTASTAPPAPPPPPAAARPTIRQGAHGPDVVYLQQKLSGLKPDGVFGPKTDGAVRTFQRGHHLEVDGVVGPLTWAAIG